MRKNFLLSLCLASLLLPGGVPASLGQNTASSTKPGSAVAPKNAPSALPVCSACIRAHEDFLASDAVQGRGSATRDELIAATYVAAQLRQYGIEPAGDSGGYIQRASTIRRKITASPTLVLTIPLSASPSWVYGKEFIALYLSQTEFGGALQKISADDNATTIKAGAVVVISGKDDEQIQRAAFAAARKGAVAEVIAESPKAEQKFADAAKQMPSFPLRLEQDDESSPKFNVLQLSTEAFQALQNMPEGAVLNFKAASEDEKGWTWNAVGILKGRDPVLQHSAVLLSAHLDHLGIGEAVNGDAIYNGADDDASGTTAVLELARTLGKGMRPRRTVIFALFGSEEIGGLGSTYFREHPPVALKDIAANLEFEMIGRPDPAIKADTLWLTGWERTNLGPALAAHGAKIVGDPHPAENFFARSDNYILAKKGVVAQTVSSFGLHPQYHQPSDDLEHLDFKYMDAAIGSLLAPVKWLVNSDFTPKWNKNGQP